MELIADYSRTATERTGKDRFCNVLVGLRSAAGVSDVMEPAGEFDASEERSMPTNLVTRECSLVWKLIR